MKLFLRYSIVCKKFWRKFSDYSKKMCIFANENYNTKTIKTYEN